MDNNVTRFEHESVMTRFDRVNRRLWVLCIIMFVAFAASNLCWMWYESQFEEVVTTTTQEISQDVSQDSGEGGNNSFVGGDYNGYTTDQTEN